MVVPTIDVIDDVTFEYRPGSSLLRGGFTKSLDYSWINLADAHKPKTTAEEVAAHPSPSMPGGLFAIDKAFWEKIGKYDLEMDVWGVRHLFFPPFFLFLFSWSLSVIFLFLF